MSRYLNKKELCEELGVSIGKVELMMKDGLKYVKFGGNVRFKVEDVDEYMEKNLVGQIRIKY